MDIASIMKLVSLLLIIVVLVILFVVLGIKGKKKITPEDEDQEEYQEEKVLTDSENCEAPLKQVFHPFNTLPKPMDPSGSECMELNEQENIVDGILDWGPDDYPNPSYNHDKMC